jgi:hypothetical protein
MCGVVIEERGKKHKKINQKICYPFGIWEIFSLNKFRFELKLNIIEKLFE